MKCSYCIVPFSHQRLCYTSFTYTELWADNGMVLADFVEHSTFTWKLFTNIFPFLLSRSSILRTLWKFHLFFVLLYRKIGTAKHLQALLCVKSVIDNTNMSDLAYLCTAMQIYTVTRDSNKSLFMWLSFSYQDYKFMSSCESLICIIYIHLDMINCLRMFLSIYKLTTFSKHSRYIVLVIVLLRNNLISQTDVKYHLQRNMK